ncbi:MAG: hypothetical protein WC761_06370 [Candidatus Paceibacterota bacterium]|jgi:hypothetical protein
MTLGDIYGKVNKSGNDRTVNSVTRSSEDGSNHAAKAPTGAALTLLHKHAEKAAYEKEVAVLRRKLVASGLHKSTDASVFAREKTQIEARLKHIDMEIRRIDGEMRHLQTTVGLEAKRHI